MRCLEYEQAGSQVIYRPHCAMITVRLLCDLSCQQWGCNVPQSAKCADVWVWVSECGCVCVSGGEQTGFTAHFALKPLTQLSQHSGKCHFGNTTFFIYEQSGGGKNLTDKSAAASSEELTRSRRGEVRCVRMKLTVEWDLTREWEAVKHNDTAATMRRREETGAAKWTGDGGQRDDKQS